MRFLKILIMICFFAIVFPEITTSQNKNNLERDTIFIANWNVENLFDFEDDPATNDSEFLPTGSKQWTDDKFDLKLRHLTQVINYMNNGCGPDIIGLEEIENINVLKKLVYKLYGRNYIMAHRDSPDERGIDASLMYDRDVFDIVDLVPINVPLPNGDKTRDILHVVLRHKISRDILHVFVNHWPSRRGGSDKSEPNRIIAAETLRSRVDSLMNIHGDTQIVILGDFNDNPVNKSISEVLNAKNFECSSIEEGNGGLLNLAFKNYKNGEGSYLFHSEWDMLDQIIISSNFLDHKNLGYVCDSFRIIKPEFMINVTEDGKEKPFPTFEGAKYLGGYSDHFPVGAKFIFQKGN